MQIFGEDKKFRDKVKSRILNIIQQYYIIVLHVKKKDLLILYIFDYILN